MKAEGTGGNAVTIRIDDATNDSPRPAPLPANRFSYRRIALRVLQFWGWTLLYMAALLGVLWLVAWIVSRANGTSVSGLLGEGSFDNPLLIPPTVATAVAAVLATWHIRRKEGFSWPQAGFPRRGALSDLHVGLWIGLLSFGVVPAAAALLGWASIEPAPWTPQTFLTLAVAGLVLLPAAAFEEFVDRGVILTLFTRRSRAIGAVLTALFFAAFHGANPGVDQIAFLSIFIAGIVLAVARYRTGAVWLPIGWHLGWNLSQGWLFGSSVSGTPTVELPLLVTRYDGPRLLVGGRFGPESGALAIGAELLALAVFLLLIPTRTGKEDMPEPPPGPGSLEQDWTAGPKPS